jgi:hypothetical protein
MQKGVATNAMVVDATKKHGSPSALINILVIGNGIKEYSVHRRIAPDGRLLLNDDLMRCNVAVCVNRQYYAVDNSDN